MYMAKGVIFEVAKIVLQKYTFCQRDTGPDTYFS